MPDPKRVASATMRGILRVAAGAFGISPLFLIGYGLATIAGLGAGLVASGVLLYVDLRFPRSSRR